MFAGLECCGWSQFTQKCQVQVQNWKSYTTASSERLGICRAAYKMNDRRQIHLSWASYLPVRPHRSLFILFRRRIFYFLCFLTTVRSWVGIKVIMTWMMKPASGLPTRCQCVGMKGASNNSHNKTRLWKRFGLAKDSTVIWLDVLFTEEFVFA